MTLENKILKEPQRTTPPILCTDKSTEKVQDDYWATTYRSKSFLYSRTDKATLSKTVHPDWRSDRKTQPGLQGFPALMLSSSALLTHLIIRDLSTQLSWFIVASLNGTNLWEKQHRSVEFCEKCQCMSEH